MNCPLCSSDSVTDYRNCAGYVSCLDCGHVDYYEEFVPRFQRQKQKQQMGIKNGFEQDEQETED